MKKLFSILFLFLFFSCAGSDVDIYDAARNGDVRVITKLYSENEKIINTPNKRGHTPLILACYRNQPKAAELLVTLGADLNYICDLGTALHAAVYKNDLEIAELLLLKKDININLMDSNKQTSLMMAVTSSSPKMVSLLLKYNADVAIVDTKGRTAFVHAMMQKNEEIIQLLRK
tara:strand:+ start:52910 stop:53431 length:522 start_codon:yes stop_codon:yes gene_type:complete